jgi:hypothetical protein
MLSAVIAVRDKTATDPGDKQLVCAVNNLF